MPLHFDFERKITALPICAHLDEITAALKNSPSRFLILTAETAAGKSTAVPPALLRAFPGKILMLEPRRLAVIAIANRIAELLGEDVGKTVGYTVYLESAHSPATRLEILTEAVFTRRLQNNPALDGVSAVIIDEFHERSVHTDLTLAFLKETMTLRSDLHAVLMSATMDCIPLARFLGTNAEPAPILHIAGRTFPVSIEYAGNISPAEAVRNELIYRRKNPDSVHPDFLSILVFLPGIASIRRCQEELLALDIPSEGEETLTLHSSLFFAEQKKVLAPPARGITRIILSSAIAETSLTVPCVSTVIDSGLSRLNRMNISSGMERLVTEQESVFSAEQRSGRAGRLAAGRCIRLWNEHEPRVQCAPPEILRSDLTQLVLECFCWGIFEAKMLEWLDAPPESAWKSAVMLLTEMGCISENKITELGKAALELGLHPRLACTALAGDVQAAIDYGSYAAASPEFLRRCAADINRRLSKIPKALRARKSREYALLAGFPDRLARLSEDGNYQFPSGRKAHLQKKDARVPLPQWIIAPDADAGETEGTVHSFLPVTAESAERWISKRAQKTVQTVFAEGKLLKTEYVGYGKIIMAAKRLPVTPEDYCAAICAEVEANGISAVPLGEEAEELIMRRSFYEQQKPDEERKASRAHLASCVKEWLSPFCAGKTALTEREVLAALHWYLDGAALDAKVPTQLVLQNGRNCRLRYEMLSSPHDKTQRAVRPVAEVIVQRLFGCTATPFVLGMPVLFKLLSPARRPLQVTDDLANFWENSWKDICKEMRGRYPKHDWDYAGNGGK